MKKTLFLVFVLCAILFSRAELRAQSPERLVPLTENPVQAAAWMHRVSERSVAVFPDDTIALPSQGLLDDFSYNSDRPDTNVWDLGFFSVYPPGETDQSGVFVNRTWALAPVNLGVCTFDGLKYNGQPYNELAGVNSTGPCDDLVSRAIDLSGLAPVDSLYLSFWYEAKGRGYAPNAQDSFLLDFNIPAWNSHGQDTTVWKNIWFSEGFSPASSDSNFRLVMIPLDSASYFVKGFRFRFHNYASQCGSNDHWHLDEVYLNHNRTINDTLPKDVNFVYPPTSALTDFWAVPHTHYKPTMMANNFNVTMRNNDNANRNVTYWYYVYDEANALLAPTPYPNATGAVDPNMPPYWTSGYENFPSVTNPPVTFSFPQSAVNADSTTFVVKHVLKENNTKFDTCTTIQKFYNYYAYDDGSAETGYGIYSPGALLAYKFTMPVGVTDDLKAIQMYFLPVQDLPNLELHDFTLMVWGDAGNQPGTVLYSQMTQHNRYSFENTNRFVTYGIDSGTVTLSGGQTYYIGWQQAAPDRMYIGFDFNDDHHDKIYYNTSGNWYTSLFNGSLMMRPVFGDVYDASGIHEQETAAQFSLYPNPANERVTIAGLKDDQKNCLVTLVDISGRQVITAQPLNADASLDVSALSPGIYFVQLRSENGIQLGTQRLVITE